MNESRMESRKEENESVNVSQSTEARMNERMDEWATSLLSYFTEPPRPWGASSFSYFFSEQPLIWAASLTCFGSELLPSLSYLFCTQPLRPNSSLRTASAMRFAPSRPNLIPHKSGTMPHYAQRLPFSRLQLCLAISSRNPAKQERCRPPCLIILKCKLSSSYSLVHFSSATCWCGWHDDVVDLMVDTTWIPPRKLLSVALNIFN